MTEQPETIAILADHACTMDCADACDVCYLAKALDAERGVLLRAASPPRWHEARRVA